MPFERPTLTELRAQVASDINAELPGVDAFLRFSNLGVLGDVQAALAHGQYGYLDWIARQMVPFTATGEYLEGWAALKGVVRKVSTQARGEVAFAAVDGAVVPVGTIVNRTDGVAYTTIAAATAADGFVRVTALAVEAGERGNAVLGAGFSLGTGISGVSGMGVAPNTIAGGSEVETDDALRSRMLAVYAAPPQGGAVTDYSAWALAVPGVTRAWVQPGAMGPGTVGILFMMDVAEAAFQGFPQGANGCSQYETRDTSASGDQLLVADSIFPRQSVTALVYALAPTPNVVGIAIAGIGAPSDSLKAAINAAIDAALLAGAVPGGRTYLSNIEALIAAVPGTQGFVITGITTSAGSVELGPAGNILSNAGALPVRGVVSYS